MANGSSTLSKLPALPAHKAGKSVWKTVAKPAKPVFTIPKVKALTKMAENMGKVITGITVNADGGFTITTGNPAHPDNAPNPFDVVLK